MKENQQAINYLEELREVNPHYQSLYLYLGQALQEEEMIEEAQTVLEEGIKRKSLPSRTLSPGLGKCFPSA